MTSFLLPLVLVLLADTRFTGIEKARPLRGLKEIKARALGSWTSAGDIFIHRSFRDGNWAITVGGRRYSSAEERESAMRSVHWTNAAHVPIKSPLDRAGIQMYYVGTRSVNRASLVNGAEAVDVWLTPYDSRVAAKAPDDKTLKRFSEVVLELDRRLHRPASPSR